MKEELNQPEEKDAQQSTGEGSLERRKGFFAALRMTVRALRMTVRQMSILSARH